MATCQRVRLSELIHQNTVPEKITDTKNEHYVTVSLYGKGVRERVIKDDKYPVPFVGYRVSEGQFIYSRIDARNGAYGIIGPELDGFVVSKDFPVYDIDTSRVLPQFLLISVLGEGFLRQIRNSSFGATNRMRIKEDILEDYSIILPPIEEQTRIAKQVSAAQSVLELRQRQLRTLDTLIKARFVEMFGDRWSNNMGWPISTLEEVSNFYTGKPHEQAIDDNGEFVLVTSRCIASDGKDVRRTNELLFPLQIGDICMVMSDVPNGNALAKCMYVERNGQYSLNQRICCFRNYQYNPIFFFYLLNRHEYLLSFNDGDSQTNLRKGDILACPMIIPPQRLQNQFAAFVSQVDKSKAVVQKALDEAQLLFDSLMQEYFG